MRESYLVPIKRTPDNKTTRTFANMSWKERNRTATIYRRPCGLEGCDHQYLRQTGRVVEEEEYRILYQTTSARLRTIVFSMCDGRVAFFTLIYSNFIRSSFNYTFKIK